MSDAQRSCGRREAGPACVCTRNDTLADNKLRLQQQTAVRCSVLT